MGLVAFFELIFFAVLVKSFFDFFLGIGLRRMDFFLSVSVSTVKNK